MPSHALPSPMRYARDILRDRRLMWVNRMYYGWVALGILLPGIVLGLVRGNAYGFVSGCLWGGFLRIFVTSQFVWSINSLCHSIGSRPFRTREQSRNNALLALPTCGEAWHNNHHAFPKSARFGLRWWQLDIGYSTIGILRLLGLAWNVWTPSAKQIAHAKLSVVSILKIDPACPMIILPMPAISSAVVKPAEPALPAIITPSAPLLATGL